MRSYLEWYPKYEPHVRWDERTVKTEVGGKQLLLVFTSYSI